MRPLPKTGYQQTHLAFPKQDLWVKLPQANRVRCRELIVQLLQAVVLVPTPTPSSHERENQT